MKIQGRIIFKSDIQRGVSQRTGNDWQSMDVVIEYHETPESRWTNSECARAFNDVVEILKTVEIGREVVADLDHSVNYYNGRYYNEVRLRKVEAAAEPQPTEKQAEGESSGGTAAYGEKAAGESSGGAAAYGETTAGGMAEGAAAEPQPTENNDDLPF